jgi:hypothetical protein
MALGRHIPDRYEHLVRCVGCYSNRARGERQGKLSRKPAPGEESAGESAARAKVVWARFIRIVDSGLGLRFCDLA